MDVPAYSSATYPSGICKTGDGSVNLNSADKKEYRLKRLVEDQKEAKRILREIKNAIKKEKSNNNLTGRPQDAGSNLEFKKKADSCTECPCNPCRKGGGSVNLDDILNRWSVDSVDKEKAKRLKQLSEEKKEVKRIIGEIENSINEQNENNNLTPRPRGSPSNSQFKKKTAPCNLKIDKNIHDIFSRSSAVSDKYKSPIYNKNVKKNQTSCPQGPCSNLQFLKKTDASTECPCNPCEKGGGNIDLHEILNPSSAGPVGDARAKKDPTDCSPCEKRVGSTQLDIILNIGSAGSVKDRSSKENLTGSNSQFMKTADASTECLCNPCESGSGNINLEEITSRPSAGAVDDEGAKVDLTGCPDGPCSNLQFMETADASTECLCTPCDKGGGKINLDEILNSPSAGSVEDEAAQEDITGCPDGPCSNLQFLKTADAFTACPCTPCEKGGGIINLDEILNPPVEVENAKDHTDCPDGPCPNLQFMKTTDASTECPCSPCEKGGGYINLDEILNPPMEVQSAKEYLTECPVGPCPNLHFMETADASTECPCSPCEKGGGTINLDAILYPPLEVQSAKEYLTECPVGPCPNLQFMETADASTECPCNPCEKGGGKIDLDAILYPPKEDVKNTDTKCPCISCKEGNGSLHLDDILNRYAEYSNGTCACSTCAKEVSCGDLDEIINRYTAMLKPRSSKVQNTNLGSSVEDKNAKKNLNGCPPGGPCSNLVFMKNANTSTKCPCNFASAGSVGSRGAKEDVTGWPRDPCSISQFIKCPCNPCEAGGGNIKLDEILNSNSKYTRNADAFSKCPCEKGGYPSYSTGHQYAIKGYPASSVGNQNAVNPYPAYRFGIGNGSAGKNPTSFKCPCSASSTKSESINLDDMLNRSSADCVDRQNAKKVTEFREMEKETKNRIRELEERDALYCDIFKHSGITGFDITNPGDVQVDNCSCDLNHNVSFQDLQFMQNLASCTCMPTCPKKSAGLGLGNGATSGPDLQFMQNVSSFNGCTCRPCPTKSSGSGLDNISVFSLGSRDFDYMTKVSGLKRAENEMLSRIQELEHKEAVYNKLLCQAGNLQGDMNSYNRQPPDINSYNRDNRASGYQKSGSDFKQKMGRGSQEILQENKRYAEEIIDMRMEVRRCMGRMTESVNREKCRSQQLQQQLMTMTNSRSSESENQYVMRDMKRQHECNCGKLGELLAYNNKLKQQIQYLGCRFNELQEDLINQRISQQHTMRIMEEQNKFVVAGSVNIVNGVMEGNGEDSLNTTARNLSKTLMYMDSCYSCSKNVHSDVKGMGKELIDLMDLIAKRNEKLNGKINGNQYCKCK